MGIKGSRGPGFKGSSERRKDTASQGSYGLFSRDLISAMIIEGPRVPGAEG
jgi:hypothetical protein